MLVVLDESVDTDENMAVAEDARAYRAGSPRVRKGNARLRRGAFRPPISPCCAGRGSYSTRWTPLPTFSNGKATIIYKANGGTGDDVIAYADLGSNYTIATNTFTAPDSKSFSKWNTNPEGTGTDYSASASYIANADLTLYAIWA